MVEIELKFFLNKKQKEFLLDLLGPSRARVYEKTTMYDNRESLMQTTDGRIRLRRSGNKFELSYKRPITREGIKKEIEYETEVSDIEQMEKILKEMGFEPTTSYERYRTTIKKANAKITIDEYPFATFIEIEGNEKVITKLANDLGLKNNITKSCDTLFAEWRLSKNLPIIDDMLFSNFNK